MILICDGLIDAYIYVSEKMKLTDRETVEYIAENPYIQYFLGLSEFRQGELFDASMMVHFRKRFPAEVINEINLYSIATISSILVAYGLEDLPEKRITRLLVICELHRQQLKMYNDKGHSVANRIVSLRLQISSTATEKTYDTARNGVYGYPARRLADRASRHLWMQNV